MRKICCFVGAPSSGKTTLATDVFVQLKKSGKNVELVHEWIRSDIQISGCMRSVWEQYRTRQHQKELEDAIPKAVEYVIVDGGLLLHYFYAVRYADPSDARERLVLQDMYKLLLDDLYLKRYDHIFYVPLMRGTAFQDGTRYQTECDILELDAHMDFFFNRAHKTDAVHKVQGGKDQRLEEMMWKILGVDYLRSI